jgi:hypothetical protein
MLVKMIPRLSRMGLATRAGYRMHAVAGGAL